MSVFGYQNQTRWRVTCDGSACKNHYDFDNNPVAIKDAEDWLIRHGWRTIEKRLHFCSYCAPKQAELQSEVTEAEQQTRLRAGRSGRYNQI